MLNVIKHISRTLGEIALGTVVLALVLATVMIASTALAFGPILLIASFTNSAAVAFAAGLFGFGLMFATLYAGVRTAEGAFIGV